MLYRFALYNHVAGCNALAQSDPVSVPDRKTLSRNVLTLLAVKVCGHGYVVSRCSIIVMLSAH
jgi:hypothetical protein